MKITKRQLRRIIKKEKVNLLREQAVHMAGRDGNVMDQLHTAIDALVTELGSEEAQMELQGIVDEWTSGSGYGGDQYMDSLIDYEEARVKQGPAKYPVTERQEGTSLKEMPSAWQQVLRACRGYSK